MSGVVHLITSLERGGAQRNTLETAARLHHRARPQLLLSGAATSSEGLDDEAARRLGPRFSHLPSLMNRFGVHDIGAVLDVQRYLSRAVERLRAPVVLHTHSSKAGFVGRVAARGVSGVVVVHTVHGFGFDALGKGNAIVVEAAERVVAPFADHFVFVSDADRTRAIDLGLCADGRVIRSGIDAARFAAVNGQRDDARAALGVVSDARVVVTLGNLKPQKDPLFHVDVYAEVVARDAGARCFFVGDGPLRAQVEERIAQRGLSKHVTLVPFVDDVSAYLAAADVFLLASAWEGLPRSVLEATAAGLPCVVKDTGWASDVAFARSITALPVDASAAAFAAAIMKKHKAAPKKLPKEFTKDGMLDELRRLYDGICGPIFEDADRIRLFRQRRRLRR